MGDAAVPGSGSDNRVAVRLLGEAAVVVGGVATRIAAAKERTVLAALALAGGSPVHVDTLTDALWDDDPPATAPKTLQNYVARLRRATGAEALRRVGDAYVLAVRPEDVDLLDVERLVRATRTHVLAGRARSADVTLRAAREQWRAVVDVGDGTHFTAGLASRVAALDLDLTEVAAEVDLGVGRDPTAELLRAVDTAPERERLWTLLVRALDVAGRQADALRAYQRARDALADVGLEPGAALRAAEAAALGERPTVGAGAVVTSLPAWLDAPAVLAGRTDVLATLDAAWSDVIGGERAVVTLGGEPGAGKTSLLAHVARRAIDAGGVVLAATASHRASQAGELVADAFAGLGAASIDELVDATAANVEPALVDRLHQELAGACAGTLARIVVDRPALVILDDVQWTDSLSAHVVARLLAILPARTFVLVAARPDGGDAAAVVSLRAALARFGRHLDVAPLDLDALGDIAEASGAPRSVAAALHERTGGNALLASELLAHGDVGGMPPSIDAIVRDRLLQLDEGDRLTVDLAAIAGPDVDARLLAEVRGQPIDAIVDALERAAAAGIVVRSTGTAGYRFPHHLTWSAVVAAIPRLAAARHHDELGRALDERAAPPALVAEHLLAAGDAGDVLVAIDAARRAAAAAMTAGALDDAAAWFRRARLALDAGAP
ncbi:MAG TPA: BTAD domain-containing putative transcriptional regulator, partial [Acidimicrobiales bacterium]|nr:BTAD domain-containing putative transcriptional regulator [Acidimicrobiales bacterium]